MSARHAELLMFWGMGIKPRLVAHFWYLCCNTPAKHYRLLDSAVVKDEAGSFKMGANVNPKQELQAILKNGGGLKLAYRLMKTSLYEYACILTVVEQACWDYYTNELETCKSPSDNLKRSWRLCDKWASEPHLFKTLEQSLMNPVNLGFMQIGMGQSQRALDTLHLAWSLVAKRAWTCSKSSAPPDCYARVLQPGHENEDARQTAVDLMKRHHLNIMTLENNRHEKTEAQHLWNACLFLKMTPVRLVLEYYRQDRYSPLSKQGCHLMFGLMATMADNKIVEDVHAPLRLESKGNTNFKLSPSTIQDVINHSNVLEQRNILHEATVSKDW
jgi:hypothetical protein